MATGSVPRRIGGIIGIALVLQTTGLASFALAAPDSPKVLLVPFLSGEGATSKQAQRFSTLLLEDLKTRDDSLVAVQAALGNSSSSKQPVAANKGGAPASAQKALELITDGQTQLNDLKFDEAVVTLQKGIDLMLANPAYALYDRVLEAYVAMAVAHFRMGEEKKAQNALFAVARLQPSYTLPEGRYPPVFVRELEKMKKRAEKAVKGTVIIEGPMGATAFLDGRDLGMVPVTEENIPIGLHYVKVEGQKGERFGQQLNLKGTSAKVTAVFKGGPAPVAAAPEPSGNPMPTGLLDANAVYRLVQACKATNSKYAIIGFVFRKNDQQLSANAALFSLDKQAFSVVPTVTFDGELLTANVEAFKLAETLVARMRSFEPTPLPHNLASRGVAVAAAPKTDNTGEYIPEVTTRKPVVAPKEEERTAEVTPPPSDEPKRETSEGGVRALRTRSVVEGETPSSVDDIDLGPIEKRHVPGDDDKGGVAWWVWAAAGVLVAGAAGGTYYGVTQATKPVTGTVTARW